MSNEHLWPEWVRKLLPPGVGEEQVEHVFTDSDHGETRRIKLRPFDLTVKDVCKPCNEGWMEDLESEVRTYISGMLQGRGRMLHRGGQTALAAWSAMKVLVFQRAAPGRKDYIPGGHFTAVYEAGQRGLAPETTTAYTAKVPWNAGLVSAPGFYRTTGLALPDASPGEEDRVHGYLATLTALDLVVQVVFREVTGSMTEGVLNHPAPIAGSFRQIWPPGESFQWPPGPALRTGGLLLAAGGLQPGEPRPFL